MTGNCINISVNLWFSDIVWFFSSECSSLLQDVQEGKHDDIKCQMYCEKYQRIFGKALACEFEGNKSQIQKLIRKVQVNADENVIVTDG